MKAKMLKYFFLPLILIQNISYAQEFQIIPVQANDLVYASDNDRVYFIGSYQSGSSHSNNLCILNPNTGEVEECHEIGNNPYTMAISSDEQFIYIGLRDLPRIVRFNRVTETIDQDFSLGGSIGTWNFYAEDINVFPNNPNAIAVAERIYGLSSPHTGVSIYENGIKRPNYTSDNWESRSITFAGDDKTLCGFYKNTSNKGFNLMTVDQNGVEVDTFYSDLLTKTTDKIEYHDGVIYTRYGSAIDMTTNPPELKGVYDIGSIGSFGLGQIDQGAVEPAKNSDRVFFANQTNDISDGYWLQIFQKSTFQLLEKIEIPIGNVGSGPRSFRKMIGLGQDGDLAILAKKSVALPNGTSLGFRIILVRNIPVSINEHNNIQSKISISIFPNPTSDKFTIQSPILKDEIVSLKLFDNMGRIVKKIEQKKLRESSIQVDLNLHPTGIYFIQIMNKEYQVLGFEKIIKH